MEENSAITDEIRQAFNDCVLDELELDVDENGLIFSITTGEYLQMDGMYLKYCDSEFTPIRYGEMRFSPIENSKLMKNIFIWYWTRVMNFDPGSIVSIQQYTRPYNTYYVGEACISYIDTIGVIRTIKSRTYKNESLRFLDLIYTMNKSVISYHFEELDVI